MNFIWPGGTIVSPLIWMIVRELKPIFSYRVATSKFWAQPGIESRYSLSLGIVSIPGSNPQPGNEARKCTLYYLQYEMC